MGEVQPVEHSAAIGVVQRDAFTAQVRRPDRHPPGVDAAIRPDEAVHPAEEQTTRVTRPADLELARRGVRQRPEAGHLTELTCCHPHDQSGATQHQHVAVLVGARDELFADRIDRARGQHGVGVPQPTHRDARRLHARHRRRLRAALGAEGFAPSLSVEQRISGAGGGVVDDCLTREHVIGHRRRGPVPVGFGRLPHRPAQELFCFTGEERGVRACVSSTADIAIEQARSERTPIDVDGRQGGHHRGDRHRRGIGPTQFGKGRQRSPPPRLVGVVFELIRCRHQQSMRDPDPRGHLTVLVRGHRLHGRRTDVDADSDRFG